MKKYIERILLSILCATSILLALTFWLNTYFGFNLFSSLHWHELSVIQASGESVSNSFYISFGVAVLALIICLNIIYRPRRIKITPPNAPQKPIEQKIAPQTSTVAPDNIPQQNTPEPDTPPQKNVVNNIQLTRPPKLNLPKNITQITANQYAQTTKNISDDDNKFDQKLDTIFSENAFLVKKNPTILGLKLNLFAIGANEIVWMGGVNCDIEKLKAAIEKIESIFTDTLEDIPITVNAFVLDTLKRYDSDSRIHIFHSIDEIQRYIDENPGEKISDDDREDFDAYSDYIDTVLTLLYT